MENGEIIRQGLEKIFSGIRDLREGFDSKRKFTIDGRLVGDIGEVLAEMEYDLVIDKVSQPDHDGTTSTGRRLQVKSTFQDHLTFKGGYDLYLGLKLYEDGSFDEIYNGPGSIIAERYKHRKGIGDKLLRFPNSELIKLNIFVSGNDKINRKYKQ